MLGNATICLLIARRPCFYKTQYALVFMLSLADLLNTLVSLPMEVASYLTYDREEYVFSPTATVFQNAIWYTLTSLSILSLMLISIEKALTIYFPFKYVFIITKRTVGAALLIVWLHGATTFTAFWWFQRWPLRGVYDFYVPRWFEDLTILINFVIPSLVNFLSYGYIFKTIIQHSRKTVNPFGEQQQHKTSKWKRDIQLARNLKNTRPFIYLAISFFIFLLPFIVYQVYLTFDPNQYYKCEGELIDSTLSMVTFANSVGNVFIYGTSNSRFRKAFRKMFNMSDLLLTTFENTKMAFELDGMKDKVNRKIRVARNKNEN